MDRHSQKGDGKRKARCGGADRMTEPKHCDEPMYLITGDELTQYALYYAENHSADFDGIGKVHKRAREFEEKIRARGPVAEQAPAPGDISKYRLIMEDELLDIDGTSDDETIFDAVHARTVPEHCPEECIYKRFSSNWKNAEAHDAALIAQEREKWERGDAPEGCPYWKRAGGHHCKIFASYKSEHDKELAAQAREDVLQEPRDCATCSNKGNAAKYVKRMQACTMRVHMKKEMDERKECCQERCKMGTWERFEFNPKVCRGYNGNCRQDGCRNFRWWHAKCNCPIIREYDKEIESLRPGQKQEGKD